MPDIVLEPGTRVRLSPQGRELTRRNRPDHLHPDSIGTVVRSKYGTRVKWDYLVTIMRISHEFLEPANG